jgi:hypothetical protein
LPHVNSRRRSKDNIDINHKQIGYEDGMWKELAQGLVILLSIVAALSLTVPVTVSKWYHSAM